MSKWDTWKEYDNYIERNIYRGIAEDEQIRFETLQKGISKGDKKIFVRNQFVALMPENCTARLKLGDHRPMVVVQIGDGVITFIPDISEEETDE